MSLFPRALASNDVRQMSDNVKVALRVRPLIASETQRGFKNALKVYPDMHQVRLGDKAFTFNYVFAPETLQEDFYRQSVGHMIPCLFKGYNLTILAYGQTGSGKTHSMGTMYNGPGEEGIIPRAVTDIFSHVKDNFSCDFAVNVSFVELYKESVYDLLSRKPREESLLEIREDVNKSVFMPGLTEVPVTTVHEALQYLQAGSKGRATSSTNMNAQSSRSHAIYTISITMTKKGTDETITAKFHLVDLAGSERPKKTGATGVTFKEGVTINMGLLALGNVISALGEGQLVFVNYREHNLTRLLKDSLGGNSITLMIACVSPADYNAEETLSTLRYADRAKRIKNKPVVNQDPKAAEIAKLKKTIQQLKLELLATQGHPANVDEGLRVENNELRGKLHSSNAYITTLLESNVLLQSAKENFTQKIDKLQNEVNSNLSKLNASLVLKDVSAFEDHVSKLMETVQTHFADINNEQKKTDSELSVQEREALRGSDTPSEEDMGTHHEYTVKQMAMNAKIQQVSTILSQKEDLVNRLTKNAGYMESANEMVETQRKVADLEKEKSELTKQLKQVNQGTKVSEQRRKRVQELEARLAVLNKKVQEQARLIKLREKDEQKITILNGEISKIKSEKVKLIRDMRQESEQFRKWKTERQVAMSKLQDRNRKQQNEIVSMQRKHDMQQNVMKRKLQEAAANARRLKDAMAVRAKVQDSKMKEQNERFGPWIRHEIDVYVSLISAKSSCSTLSDHRDQMQQQLDRLKEDPIENADEIQKLESGLEVRSIQIADLQQKIIESDEETKRRMRFDNLQTMAEAKVAIKTLFDLTTQSRIEQIEKEHKIEALEAAQCAADELAKQWQITAQEQEKKNLATLSEVEKNYEEKTELLLKQLCGVDIQNNDERSQQQIKALQQRLEKCEADLQTASEAAVSQSMKTSTKRSATTETYAYKEVMTTTDEDNSEPDETSDPDWRLTPIGKRLPKTGLELPNQGVGCTCKGTCVRCTCKTAGNRCSLACYCNKQKCRNGKTPLVKVNESDIICSDHEEEFHYKRPRLTGLYVSKTKLQFDINDK